MGRVRRRGLGCSPRFVSPLRRESSSSHRAAIQEELECRIAGLVPRGIAERLDGFGEPSAVGERHDEARQHAAVIGAVVPVMKQRDVPELAEAIQEIQQRAGMFRKLEPVDHLVFEAGDTASKNIVIASRNPTAL